MKLIGIIGKKYSGKDTFFELAFEYLSLAPEGLGIEEPIRMAFGDALKEEIARATGMGVESIEQAKALYRPLLQWWGTEFRRGIFGGDYWIRRLHESAAWRHHNALRARPGLNFITDVRFLDEARFIQDDGGILIRIVRPSLPDSDGHQSESEQDRIVADHTLINDGSLAEFAARVSKLIPTLFLKQS